MNYNVILLLIAASLTSCSESSSDSATTETTHLSDLVSNAKIEPVSFKGLKFGMSIMEMAKITNATKPQSCLSAIGSSWSYADITGWNAICGEKYGLPESDALYHGLCQISGVDFKKSVGELTEVFSKIFGKFEVDSSGAPYAKANGAYIKIQDMSQGFMKATSVRIISLDCLEKEKQIQDEKSFNKIDKAKQDL